ncbi:MAG: threonine/serine exporter family protein, partial [Phycisphaerales bacterium]|nr:threonine/serine exporter family protein [Phycisphaerales bacterium]
HDPRLDPRRLQREIRVPNPRPPDGIALAAACVGVASNVYARITNRPAAIVVLPGLLILVPGSVGFRSLTAFLDADTLGGLQTAIGVFFIGVSIVVGLLLANVIVQPRKAL